MPSYNHLYKEKNFTKLSHEQNQKVLHHRFVWSSYKERLNDAIIENRISSYKRRRELERNPILSFNGLDIGNSSISAFKWLCFFFIMIGFFVVNFGFDSGRTPFNISIDIAKVFSDFGTYQREQLVGAFGDLKAHSEWVRTQITGFDGNYNGFITGIVDFFKYLTVPFVYLFFIFRMFFVVIGGILMFFFNIIGALFGV